MLKKQISLAVCGALMLGTFPTMCERVEAQMVTQFMDCMDAMPIVERLSEDCWGAEQVGARDQGNGLEDRNMENYSYWDGGIVKDEETGKYYMFASRWNQAGGHWGQDGILGWRGSQAIYAVSDNLYGPYEDKGAIWPEWCEGAGHNVFPFKISETDSLYNDGYRYCICVSDTGMHGDVANGTLHIAKSISGPWELVDNSNSGKLKANGNFSHSNIGIMVRPDGKYEATNRNGDIAIADSVAGEWKVELNGLWNTIVGLPQGNLEDPVIWYSDGLYHIVVNKWDIRRAFYLTSTDGINDWMLRPGTAYTPTEEFLRYTDGTKNNWTKLERPNIYVENGEIAAMTFAVIDVQKEEDFGNDSHGSKVIVVPFSSEKLKELDAQKNPLELREGIACVDDTNIQSWKTEETQSYASERFIQLQKDSAHTSLGMGELGEGKDKPMDSYDTKIGFVKFNIDQLDTDGKSVFISLVYLSKEAGDAETTRIQAAIADTNWNEQMTWKNQPSIYYDVNDLENTTALSAEFSTADVLQEVKIDVTKLVNNFKNEHPNEKIICFALNSTATSTRLRIGSSEGGKITQPLLCVGEKNITVKINGEVIVPKDANSNVVQPINVNGSVFVPVRAIAEAFNKKVEWNADTMTVEIFD